MSNSTSFQNNTSSTKARNDTQGNKDSFMNSSQTISFPLTETNASFIGYEGSEEDTTAIALTPFTTDEVATLQNATATSTTEDHETDVIDTFSSSAQNIPELKPGTNNDGNASLHSIPNQRLDPNEHDGFKVSEVLSNLGKSIINHHIESYIKNKTKEVGLNNDEVNADSNVAENVEVEARTISNIEQSILSDTNSLHVGNDSDAKGITGFLSSAINNFSPTNTLRDPSMENITDPVGYEQNVIANKSSFSTALNIITVAPTRATPPYNKIEYGVEDITDKSITPLKATDAAFLQATNSYFERNKKENVEKAVHTVDHNHRIDTVDESSINYESSSEDHDSNSSSSIISDAREIALTKNDNIKNDGLFNLDDSAKMPLTSPAPTLSQPEKSRMKQTEDTYDIQQTAETSSIAIKTIPISSFNEIPNPNEGNDYIRASVYSISSTVPLVNGSNERDFNSENLTKSSLIRVATAGSELPESSTQPSTNNTRRLYPASLQRLYNVFSQPALPNFNPPPLPSSHKIHVTTLTPSKYDPSIALKNNDNATKSFVSARENMGTDELEYDGFKVSELLSDAGKAIINHHIDSYIKNKTIEVPAIIENRVVNKTKATIGTVSSLIVISEEGAIGI